MTLVVASTALIVKNWATTPIIARNPQNRSFSISNFVVGG